MADLSPAKPIARCEAVSKVRRDDSAYGGSWGSPSWSRKADAAETALTAALKADEAAHVANAEALTHNRCLREAIKATMAAAGIKDEYRVRDTKSRSIYPKSKTVRAGYLEDMAHFIPLNDGFDAAEKLYKELSERFAGWRKKADEEKAATVAARAAELARRQADMQLATILARYGLAADADDWSILRSLRERNKYLDLALAMEDVRGNWNDGCDAVADALGRFEISDGDDPVIAADVASAVVRFSEDRDGRVFRDTGWCYDRLYSKVADKQLVGDARFMRRRHT